jgi:DNA-binding MarR family transcriptional regulator
MSNYIKFSNKVLRNPELSTGCRALYSVLCSYANINNTCFPGISRLADDLGVTQRQINRYMKELVDKEAIARIENPGKSTLTVILEQK